MKILLASDFFYPMIGGAERQVQLLSQELSRRGHTVCVATVWQTGLPEHEILASVPVYRLKALSTRVPWFSKNPKRRFHPPFPDPGIVWGLRQVLRQFQPDVVHACGWIAYSCALALRNQSPRLLVSVRDYGYSCALRTLYQGRTVCAGPGGWKCIHCAAQEYGWPKALAAVSGVRMGKALLTSRVDGIHSISTYIQATVRRDLFNRDRPSGTSPRTVKEFLIPSFLGQTTQERGTQNDTNLPDRLPDRPFILFVGAFQNHKGLGPLLAAYQALDSAPPLVLIGTVWPDTPKVFPPGVVVLTDLPHPQVMCAWEKCLFGVAPSTWPEPLGAVIFEAMSAGKAIIGTFPGGHTDQIAAGETGLLVPAGEVAGLYHAMRYLIDNAEHREKMGQMAARRIQRFLADAVVPQFGAAYEQLVHP